MTDQLGTSTTVTFTGEFPVYQPQENVRTYEITKVLSYDLPRISVPRSDFVVLNAPPTVTYIHAKVDVAAHNLRRAIAALNEKLQRV